MNEITLRPQTMAELTTFAEMAAQTEMVPKAYAKNPSAIVVAVMMGHELGLPPLAALQNIAVINGRPSVWGDAMLAIVQGSGQLEDINEEWDEKTKTATCHYVRKGRTPQSSTFSMDDAALAGLSKKQGPWQQYPKRMCKLRARGFALRDGFADQLRGIGIAEEERDKETTERDVTPAAAPVSALRIPEVHTKKFSFSEVEACIHAASTAAKLKAAGVMSNNANINDAQRETLRTLWTSKMDSLKSKKDVTNVEA
jgi:hypothetical protein